MGLAMHCGLERLSLNSLEGIEDDSDSAECAALGINVAMIYVVEILHARSRYFLDVASENLSR